MTTQQLAEVVTRLYWPQVAPFEGVPGGLLRQNTGNPARVLTLVAEARDQLGGGGGLSSARARQREPEAYRRLVREVEWKLVQMPLPRLQEFREGQERFIYEIAWDRAITRSEFNDPRRFQNVIRFQPGVAAHLVRLDGLLRPLLYRDWAMQVARINQLPVARLDDHLFGVDRAALRPVLAGLRELQDDRCFYCEARLSSPQVDHFLPWARVSLDAIENLVVAHDTCNGSKTDHLAAAAHVEQWRARLDGAGSQLAAIAGAVSWESSPARALGVARGLYLPLQAGARVWASGAGLIPLEPQRLHAALAA